MFDQLIVSQPVRRRSATQSAVSLALHGALGFAAVKATATVVTPPPPIAVDVRPFVLPAEPRRTVATSSPAGPTPTPSTDPPIVIVAAPVVVPSEIPPADPTAHFDPHEYSGRPGPGAPATGPEVGDPRGTTFVANEVDEPVVPIDRRLPKYPPVLQQAGIAGSVDAQFVVDSSGTVEPTSWRVLRSTNRAFEEPARDAVLASTFKPARIRGRAVRQLVAQRISFSIGS